MSALTLRTLAPCFLFSVLFHSHAGGAGKDEAGGTLGIYIENDLFAGTDRNGANLRVRLKAGLHTSSKALNPNACSPSFRRTLDSLPQKSPKAAKVSAIRD